MPKKGVVGNLYGINVLVDDNVDANTYLMTTTASTAVSPPLTFNELRKRVEEIMAGDWPNEYVRVEEYRRYTHQYRRSSSEPRCCRDCYERWREERYMEERVQRHFERMLIQMTEMQMMAMKPPMMLMSSNIEVNEDGTLSPKKGKNMNVVKKLKALTLDNDDRLLRKYGLVGETGDLTTEGREVLWSLLLNEHKAKLVEKVKELDADEKSKKKD